MVEAAIAVLMAVPLIVGLVGIGRLLETQAGVERSRTRLRGQPRWPTTASLRRLLGYGEAATWPPPTTSMA